MAIPTRMRCRTLKSALGKQAVLSDPRDLKLYEYDGGVDKSLPELWSSRTQQTTWWRL